MMITATLTSPQPDKAREYFAAKMAYTTGPVELERAIRERSVTVVDVRAKSDYDKGHIPGAISLPKDQWDTAVNLSRDHTNVIYCYSQVCHLGAAAALELASQGFPVQELEGGFEGWKTNLLPIEK